MDTHPPGMYPYMDTVSILGYCIHTLGYCIHTWIGGVYPYMDTVSKYGYSIQVWILYPYMDTYRGVCIHTWIQYLSMGMYTYTYKGPGLLSVAERNA